MAVFIISGGSVVSRLFAKSAARKELSEAKFVQQSPDALIYGGLALHDRKDYRGPIAAWNDISKLVPNWYRLGIGARTDRPGQGGDHLVGELEAPLALAGTELQIGAGSTTTGHLPLDFRASVQEVLASRYELQRELDRGGMAMVFARDVKHDRDVSLKVLRPVSSLAVGSARSLREIRIAAELKQAVLSVRAHKLSVFQ